MTKIPQSNIVAEAKAPKGPTKLDQLIARLRTPAGATMAEMMAITGWQAHSVRGALAGQLRKKGHANESQVTDGVRRWRIASPAEAAQ